MHMVRLNHLYPFSFGSIVLFYEPNSLKERRWDGNWERHSYLNEARSPDWAFSMLNDVVMFTNVTPQCTVTCTNFTPDDPKGVIVSLFLRYYSAGIFISLMTFVAGDNQIDSCTLFISAPLLLLHASSDSVRCQRNRQLSFVVKYLTFCIMTGKSLETARCPLFMSRDSGVFQHKNSLPLTQDSSKTCRRDYFSCFILCLINAIRKKEYIRDF